MSKNKKSKNSNNINTQPTNNSNIPNSMSNSPKTTKNTNQNSTPLPSELVDGIQVKLKLVDELNQKIKELEANLVSKEELINNQKEIIDTTNNKMIRVLADGENLKKHQEHENQQIKKNLKKSIAKNVLVYLNNQYLALNFLKEIEDDKTKSVLNTIKISFDSVVADLAKQNIEFIIPQVGQEFDPESMQAISKNTDDDKVTTIVSLGLKVDDQVIQPASVFI